MTRQTGPTSAESNTRPVCWRVLERGKEHCGRQRECVTGFLNDLLNHITLTDHPFLYTLEVLRSDYIYIHAFGRHIYGNWLIRCTFIQYVCSLQELQEFQEHYMSNSTSAKRKTIPNNTFIFRNIKEARFSSHWLTWSGSTIIHQKHHTAFLQPLKGLLLRFKKLYCWEKACNILGFLLSAKEVMNNLQPLLHMHGWTLSLVHLGKKKAQELKRQSSSIQGTQFTLIKCLM